MGVDARPGGDEVPDLLHRLGDIGYEALQRLEKAHRYFRPARRTNYLERAREWGPVRDFVRRFESTIEDAAKRRGYDLSAQRAKHLSKRDFEEFDLVLAMDRGHLRILQRLCPPQHAGKVRMFIQETDVPDPYYGGPESFEQVLDLVEKACEGLLGEIR